MVYCGMSREQDGGEGEEKLSIPEKIVERVTAVGREGSVRELKSDIAYLDHVRSNPTKSLDEALMVVHEQIAKLGGYVTSGVEAGDIEETNRIVSLLIEKGIFPGGNKWMLDAMIAKIEKRKDEGLVAQNSGILIALDPDNRKLLVVDVQKRSDNGIAKKRTVLV